MSARAFLAVTPEDIFVVLNARRMGNADAWCRRKAKPPSKRDYPISHDAYCDAYAVAEKARERAFAEKRVAHV